MHAELAITLMQLIEAVTPRADGLVVTSADIELPLEVTAAVHRGRLTFLARPPHSRWRSGFQSTLHRGRLSLALEEA